jgi:septum formation protein
MVKLAKIILASASPRRKDLLNIIGLDFIVDVSEVDETVPERISPDETVRVLSCKKARAVAERHEEGLIIGADTIVVLGNEVLGKPENKHDAFTMLNKLQGKVHQVYSGVTVMDASTKEYDISYQVTNVEFKPMTGDEILRYIATGEPKGKAGAYAIQGYGATMVKRIEGDYFNVVGLPLFLLSEMLAKFNIKIF